MSEPGVDAVQKAEFSRTIRVDHLRDLGGEQGETFSFAADEDERVALAQRFGLLALNSLEADVIATRYVSKGRRRKAVSGVRLRVKFRADVIQSCVVTLEPVAAQVAQGFEVVYLPAGADQGDAEFVDGEAVEVSDGEVVIDIDEVDPPELLQGNEVDVGEVIAENLSLALDPYPRAPGAEIDAGQAEFMNADEQSELGAGDPEDEIATNNPFAVLKKLKTSD